MPIDNIDELIEISARRVRNVPNEFKRYLYDKIDWRDRLIQIKGARGVGKTTLMLQYIKENFKTSKEALYISLDNLWFADKSLREVAEYFYLHGGTHLFIDETHYLRNWQQEIKNIYDDFPELHIIYSGSALLKLEKGSADLSRRQISYTLQGLSFREYLEYEKIGKYDAVDLEMLLQSHEQLAMEITADKKILLYFDKYLISGYYPFYKEVFSGYHERIKMTLNEALENDYPAIEDVSFSTIQKTKKMLILLAQNSPQTPNMNALYRELETDRNQGLKMLNTLSNAGILNLLSAASKSLKNMSRPDKIYCNNSNIMAALVRHPDIGCMRETFFMNQMLAAGYEASYPPEGDFLINDLWLFEVGGKNKTFAQIRNIENSYLAVDNIEVGTGNRIPLWIFGFLY